MSGILPRDTYEYLMNFADDRTILNMVRANKQFDNQDFFRRVMERRYPHLLTDKKEGESWKQLYLRTMKYIGLLKEVYDFPYVPVPGFIPGDVYQLIKNQPKIIYNNDYPIGNIWTYGLSFAVKSDNDDWAYYMIIKGADPTEYIRKLAKNGDLEGLQIILEYLIIIFIFQLEIILKRLTIIPCLAVVRITFYKEYHVEFL